MGGLTTPELRVQFPVVIFAKLDRIPFPSGQDASRGGFSHFGPPGRAHRGGSSNPGSPGLRTPRSSGAGGDAEIERVTYRSDKADGPTAGTATGDPLEFLARLVTHIPDPGQVMQRYDGWYASQTRGARRRQGLEPSGTEGSVALVEPADWSLRAARFRWAELLRRIVEVDPLRCPQCQGLMRIVAGITDPAVLGRILAHRARARDHAHRSRSPPPRRRRSPTPTAADPPHR